MQRSTHTSSSIIPLVGFLLLLLWIWYAKPPTLRNLFGIAAGLGTDVFLCISTRVHMEHRARPDDPGLKLAAFLRWLVATLICVGVFALQLVLLRYHIDHKHFLAHAFVIAAIIALIYDIIKKY